MTLLLHKPPGYTCSHVGEHGSRTIFDLLPVRACERESIRYNYMMMMMMMADDRYRL